MPATRKDFQRYAELIAAPMRDSLVDRAFVATAETNEIVQVERGIVFPQALHADDDLSRTAPAVDRLIDVADRVHRMVVVDRAGHHRPVYKPLLVYAWLQAYRIGYEALPREAFGKWEEGARAWCDQIENDLGAASIPATIPASSGAAIGAAAWSALALHVAGKVFVRDAWTDLAADAMGKIARAQQMQPTRTDQQPGGPFLLATASDNPETHWYHELILLHALSSYAVQAEDRHVAGAVRRATAFHLNETEPNHASDAPWALFAFVWNPTTRPIADQLLHVAQTRPPSEMTLMLLADALYCVRLFNA